MSGPGATPAFAGCNRQLTAGLVFHQADLRALKTAELVPPGAGHRCSFLSHAVFAVGVSAFHAAAHVEL